MRNPNAKYATTSKDSSFSHCCQHAKNSYLTRLFLLHARVSKFKIKKKKYFQLGKRCIFQQLFHGENNPYKS